MHKNAVLTPEGRGRAVGRVEGGEAIETVAFSVGVSRRTMFKWVRRWREQGPAGLVDRSSRPHRSPGKTKRTIERQVIRLREKRWSTPRIADALQLPISTVGVICRRHGLGRLPRLEPPMPVVRYQWSRPGEMVHLDIKKLGRIEKIGHRIHGDRSRRAEGAGWEFLHVCIDDASRVSYAELLPDEKGETCTAFLKRSASWFASHGVQIERVMTDNGCGYVAKVFRRAVAELGARHVLTKPYTPKTNGKAERFIQTCKRDWAYAQPYSHSDARAAALPAFLNFYNNERPHWGLNRMTPRRKLAELVTNVSGSNT